MRNARTLTGLSWGALLISALTPLAVFVYLGSQSRLMGDDFKYLFYGDQLGPLGTVQFWRANWHGAYSDQFVHGLLASFRETLPRAALAVYVFTWVLGLAWLGRLAMPLLRFNKRHRLIAAVFATAIIGSFLHGVLSPLSIYYYSASIRYTLPLALLTVYAAATLHCISRPRAQTPIGLAVMFGAIFCFLNAGFSEIYLIYRGVRSAFNCSARSLCPDARGAKAERPGASRGRMARHSHKRDRAIDGAGHRDTTRAH